MYQLQIMDVISVHSCSFYGTHHTYTAPPFILLKPICPLVRSLFGIL